ncbi:cell elongation-specific peptidoglycan biosynthesis regulator RodA [Plasticicumulans lactativorans]|uniref:Peptidoglycan glycosyltransferase MrdB n=1 Tax=Plasticicumulans lactativorans TaxID=1133106 RepID=A0A4R2KWH3_9GAMM|nr:rod shape-determining protein RodA [Plasticicumulans lactativorans]TCO78881.1 cell elongation-specific peptidoglycan biosynthesis regulator RodA [Plasticicumulans lactativorans]
MSTTPYHDARPLLDSAAPRLGLLARVHLDGPLILGLLAIAGAGQVVLYSATRQDLESVIRQGSRLGLGFAVMIALAQVPTQYLRRATPWIYLIGLLLLMAVLAFGDISMGAQRWLDLGFVRFQPSEIMKLGVPLMMAWHFADKPLPPRLGHLLVGALVAGVPFVLIAKQPDLGTALVILSAGLFALFLGGIAWRIIIGLGAIAAVAAPLFWEYGMREYQRQRVRTLFDPEADPLGAGYHIIQSKIAIGSGGIYGKGWLNGTQSHLEFLPESHTDFILGTLAEEFGLIGVCILLTLYFFVITRALWLASRAPDTFGRITGGTLALVFFFYAFVNTGMVSGILPVVGVPLPLVSYGGTSLVTIMAGFGILMGLHSHRPRT